MSYKLVLCFVFVWGIMGKCGLFLLMLKIILLQHKVGLCLHGHICTVKYRVTSTCYIYEIHNIHDIRMHYR